MKIGSEEPNGPVSPVWHSLKGFSSRDTGLGPLSPGAGSLGAHGNFPPLSGSSPTVGATSAPLTHSSKSSLSFFGVRAPSSLTADPMLPCGPIRPQDHSDDPGEAGGPFPQNPFCGGMSSSTTSTSLSNPGLGLTPNNIVDFGDPIGPLRAKRASVPSAAKDDPQAFSIFSAFHGMTSPFVDIYRHSRINNKKLRRRIVHKNGECNITKAKVAKRRKRFLQDIFTTLLDIQWRWTLLIFALSFVLSWILFAAVWYAIVYNHGDLLPDHLPNRQAESGWTPCVMNIFSFASCFLFSVETQHTIGYGSRHTTEECPQAIFFMCIQSITGVILQAFMGGVIFTKLSRPKKRTHTLIFSREACICQRDGELCLLFRVGDMRKSHIIEAHIRVQLIKERVTEEGEKIPYYQHELDVGYDGGEDRILFIWPMTIVHKIDESSPLYHVSAHDLSQEKFEIIVMLEGVIENTGMTIQARSSYLPSEIKWGYRFRPMLTFREELGECSVDYSLFNEMYEVVTPLCSAKYLEQFSSRESTPVTPTSPLASPGTILPKIYDSVDNHSVSSSASKINSVVSASSSQRNSLRKKQRDEDREASNLKEDSNQYSMNGRYNNSQSAQPIFQPLEQV